MHSNHLPDFERTLAITKGELNTAELSECHGIACALLCRFPECSLDDYLGLLGDLELVSDASTALRSSLDELLIASRRQMNDENLGLSLWLPNDEEMLEERTMALSQWCSGFLAALGSGGSNLLDGLPEDANEALKDLQQISMADVTDTRQSEEDENAFVEIVEYIRVVVLLIREELRVPDQQEIIH